MAFSEMEIVPGKLLCKEVEGEGRGGGGRGGGVS